MKPLEILIAAPGDRSAPTGNVITALRWRKIIESLGHRARIKAELDDKPFDLLIALHAGKSGAAVAAPHALKPDRHIVVGIAGTDVYADEQDPVVARSLELASRIVALQPSTGQRMHDERLRVIVQSVEVPAGLPSPAPGSFDVCVLGHLRAVKDPLRTALAVRDLDPESLVHVFHLGRALEPEWEELARREDRRNPRYTWLGALPRDAALAVLARCRLHVSTSHSEGGANALSEAIALGVPTIATRIDGSVGLLGEDWPALFEVGETAALSELLSRAEREAEFLDEL